MGRKDVIKTGVPTPIFAGQVDLAEELNVEIEESVSSVEDKKYDKWEVVGDAYYPTGTQTTIPKLKSGYYKIGYNPNAGSYYTMSKSIKTDGLIELPIKEGEEIIKHVQEFWDEKIIERYKKYNMLHKTGVIMHGPPGSGKTSIINTLIKNLVNIHEGLIFSIEDENDIHNYSNFMQILRQIEPNRPIITIIEDMDGLLDNGRSVEKMLLNILDGINQIEHVAYIATTNYPERMQQRLINRPGRFDRRFKIGYPDAVCRKAFFEFKFVEGDLENFDIKKMVKETEGLTISHCKELFVEHVVKGRELTEIVEELKEMDKAKLTSEDDRGKRATPGFNKGYDNSVNDRFEEAFPLQEIIKKASERRKRGPKI